MKKVLASALMLAALSTAALAADMPARTYTKAPVMIPTYNWTGLYIGLNAGGGFAHVEGTGAVGAAGNGDMNGFIGGAQIGYNWQFNQIVLGLEADYQYADQDNNNFAGGAGAGAFTGNNGIRSFGTIRGRVGYAWDRWMIYATGGYAYLDLRNNGVFGGVAGSNNGNSDGYTVGGGLEYAFAGPWSAKLEYLYIQTDNNNFAIGAGTFGGRIEDNIVRVGLNYKLPIW